MTQAADIDIREIKSAIESIARGTEANTKAIADLATSVTGLREEMRVGFATVDTRFTKLEGKIENLDTKLIGRIDTLEAKFEERTKGFGLRLDGKELVQRNITTGLTVAIVGGLLLTLAKYLFLGVNP
jgi:hypothetical protein